MATAVYTGFTFKNTTTNASDIANVMLPSSIDIVAIYRTVLYSAVAPLFQILVEWNTSAAGA